MIIFYVLIFILGIVIGSFLNVIIIRLNAGESIFKKRSHCLYCKTQLHWYELIPVISFIAQKGKCRRCRKNISLQYPLVEVLTGILFLLMFLSQQPIFNMVFWLIMSCFLVIVFVSDLRYYSVPDAIIYPAIVIAFFYNFHFWLAGLIGGAFFLFILLISKGKWIGMGDVKIGVLMGLLLGLTQIFVALFLAFFIGAIVSVVLMAMRKKNLKSEIPFGPFLIGATFISLFLGEILLKLYLGILD